jgi:hypothetical protein
MRRSVSSPNADPVTLQSVREPREVREERECVCVFRARFTEQLGQLIVLSEESVDSFIGCLLSLTFFYHS